MGAKPLVKGSRTGKFIISTEHFTLGMYEWVSELRGCAYLEDSGWQ